MPQVRQPPPHEALVEGWEEVSSLEVAVSALRDAVEVAKSWRSRCLALEKAAKRALSRLEKGDVEGAWRILLEALSEKGGAA